MSVRQFFREVIRGNHRRKSASELREVLEADAGWNVLGSRSEQRRLTELYGGDEEAARIARETAEYERQLLASIDRLENGAGLKEAEMARLGPVRCGRGGYMPMTSDELASWNTIHSTGGIDVEIGENGEVLAVWFRCLNLPFTVYRQPRANFTPVHPEIEITGIDWRDRL
jgi:hypothetical protein